ncbi:MAG: hypothetical protein AB7Q37_18485 [Pyrinomonadaceae bacterium]
MSDLFKTSSRPTIMDGTVVTFAVDFRRSEGAFGSNDDALGPFEISASRNAVIVHRAEINDRDELEAFIAAMRGAAEEASRLSICDRGSFKP